MIGNKFIHAIFVVFETTLFIMVILLSVAIYAESKAENTTETFVGPPESTKRLIEGNYFDCGLIFTDDGEIWEYYDPTESIPEDYRVVVCFDTNRTESDLQDDEVLKMVEMEHQDGSNWLYHFLNNN